METKLFETILPKDIIGAQRKDEYTRKNIDGLSINPTGPYFMHEGMLYKHDLKEHDL